jgi:hypothetical protein
MSTLVSKNTNLPLSHSDSENFSLLNLIRSIETRSAYGKEGAIKEGFKFLSTDGSGRYIPVKDYLVDSSNRTSGTYGMSTYPGDGRVTPGAFQVDLVNGNGRLWTDFVAGGDALEMSKSTLEDYFGIKVDENGVITSIPSDSASVFLNNPAIANDSAWSLTKNSLIGKSISDFKKEQLRLITAGRSSLDVTTGELSLGADTRVVPQSLLQKSYNLQEDLAKLYFYDQYNGLFNRVLLKEEGVTNVDTYLAGILGKKIRMTLTQTPGKTTLLNELDDNIYGLKTGDVFEADLNEEFLSGLGYVSGFDGTQGGYFGAGRLVKACVGAMKTPNAPVLLSSVVVSKTGEVDAARYITYDAETQTFTTDGTPLNFSQDNPSGLVYGAMASKQSMPSLKDITEWGFTDSVKRNLEKYKDLESLTGKQISEQTSDFMGRKFTSTGIKDALMRDSLNDKSFMSFLYQKEALPYAINQANNQIGSTELLKKHLYFSSGGKSGLVYNEDGNINPEYSKLLVNDKDIPLEHYDVPNVDFYATTNKEFANGYFFRLQTASWQDSSIDMSEPAKWFTFTPKPFILNPSLGSVVDTTLPAIDVDLYYYGYTKASQINIALSKSNPDIKIQTNTFNSNTLGSSNQDVYYQYSYETRVTFADVNNIERSLIIPHQSNALLNIGEIENDIKNSLNITNGVEPKFSVNVLTVALVLSILATIAAIAALALVYYHKHKKEQEGKEEQKLKEAKDDIVNNVWDTVLQENNTISNAIYKKIINNSFQVSDESTDTDFTVHKDLIDNILDDVKSQFVCKQQDLNQLEDELKSRVKSELEKQLQEDSDSKQTNHIYAVIKSCCDTRLGSEGKIKISQEQYNELQRTFCPNLQLVEGQLVLSSSSNSQPNMIAVQNAPAASVAGNVYSGKQTFEQAQNQVLNQSQGLEEVKHATPQRQNNIGGQSNRNTLQSLFTPPQSYEENSTLIRMSTPKFVEGYETNKQRTFLMESKGGTVKKLHTQ